MDAFNARRVVWSDIENMTFVISETSSAFALSSFIAICTSLSTDSISSDWFLSISILFELLLICSDEFWAALTTSIVFSFATLTAFWISPVISDCSWILSAVLNIPCAISCNDWFTWLVESFNDIILSDVSSTLPLVVSATPKISFIMALCRFCSSLIVCIASWSNCLRTLVDHWKNNIAITAITIIINSDWLKFPTIIISFMARITSIAVAIITILVLNCLW